MDSEWLWCLAWWKGSGFFYVPLQCHQTWLDGNSPRETYVSFTGIIIEHVGGMWNRKACDWLPEDIPNFEITHCGYYRTVYTMVIMLTFSDILPKGWSYIAGHLSTRSPRSIFGSEQNLLPQMVFEHCSDTLLYIYLSLGSSTACHESWIVMSHGHLRFFVCTARKPPNQLLVIRRLIWLVAWCRMRFPLWGNRAFPRCWELIHKWITSQNDAYWGHALV